MIGRLKAAISAHYTEGEEVEFVKQIDDPIAKFALLMEVLEDSPELTHIDDSFNISDRDELDAGDFVAIHGGLKRTPLKEIADMLDFAEDIQQIQQGLDELSGLDLLSEENQEELDSLRDETEGMSTAVQGMQRLVSAFSREDDIYRAVISDGSDIEFVLIPDEENFQNLPMDFPSVDNDYLILGKYKQNSTREIRSNSSTFLSWFPVQLITLGRRRHKKSSSGCDFQKWLQIYRDAPSRRMNSLCHIQMFRFSLSLYTDW